MATPLLAQVPPAAQEKRQKIFVLSFYCLKNLIEKVYKTNLGNLESLVEKVKRKILERGLYFHFFSTERFKKNMTKISLF